MRLALFQPDIAGNVGTILRLCACFDVPCDIIEPCGFPFSDKALKRAGMDYAAAAVNVRHPSWSSFANKAQTENRRLILMSSKGSESVYNFQFFSNDIILMGSESAGVPEDVHAMVDGRIKIPMAAGFRSLNVAVAAGIALSEALRQTSQLPSGA